MKKELVKDENGVVWSERRDDQNMVIKRVKVNDPNFVQDRVPTPRVLDIAIGAIFLAVLAGLIVLALQI